MSASLCPLLIETVCSIQRDSWDPKPVADAVRDGIWALLLAWLDEPSLYDAHARPLAVLGVLRVSGQTEMKRVVGDNATLPCHHQLWQADTSLLDIEWLLVKPNAKQKVVITYFAGRTYDPNEGEPGRLSLAGDYLKGDASLMISDLSLSDSGEYSCKVKNGGKYHWNTVNLIVLVKPSKPRCWMEGRLLEGSDVKMSCKSSDGSDPIRYKWERVLDKGKYLGKLPPLALLGKCLGLLIIGANLDFAKIRYE
uniref:Ig-like domain-containing protein n=1 Tax=Astyanax mexicanus TaxID=7994 RepID=A0A8B9KVW6_ASTMX